jgi:Ca2+-binding EF-hand superfamily protein/LysM repeat protein
MKGAENVEAPKTAESQTSKVTVQINEAENKQLNQVTEAQSAQLKAAGILPELAISGGSELDYVKNNFDKLDKSKDGHVTKEEIDDYIKNNKELSKQEVEALTKAAANIGNLQNNNRDAQLISTGKGAYYGPEGGITKKDLDVANQRMKAEEYANKNFDKFDTNNDGHVNAEELQAYMKANEGKLSKEETANLQQLIKDMDRLQGMANDEWFWESKGFTQRDLKVARAEEGTAGIRIATGNFKFNEQPSDKPADKPGDQPGQKGEPGKKAGDNPAVGDHEYTIKPGDSFWKISKENLKAQTGKEPSNAEVVKAMNELAKANGMKLTDVIHPGQKLKVPGPDKGEPCAVEPAPRRGETTPRRGEQNTRRGENETRPVPRPESEQPEPRTNPEAKPAESASQVLQRRFSEIDKDGNNKVNRKEIEKYLNDHAKDLSAEEVRALDMMARSESKIRTLVDDEKGPENSGMSRKDLQKLDEVQRVGSAMLNGGMFNEIDGNHNRFLSKDEITKALTTRNLSRHERLTLEFLKDNLKILQTGVDDEKGPENNGVSQADLRYFASLK